MWLGRGAEMGGGRSKNQGEGGVARARHALQHDEDPCLDSEHRLDKRPAQSRVLIAKPGKDYLEPLRAELLSDGHVLGRVDNILGGSERSSDSAGREGVL